MRYPRCTALFLPALLALMGCGRSGADNPFDTITVTVSPRTATVTADTSQAFSATLMPTSYQGVDWILREGAAGGSVLPSGLYTAPDTPGTYHLVATSHDNPRKSDTATIRVVAAPAIDGFTASATGISPGGSVHLQPVFSGGTGVITPGVGAVQSGSTYTVAPAQSTTYTLTVTNDAGTAVTTTVLVEVVGIQSFTASPTIVTLGSPATLVPVFSGGTGAITPGIGTINSGDSITVTPTQDTLYTLTVSHPSGLTATATATVQVVAAPAIQSFTASPNPLTLGQNATLMPVFTGGTGAIAPNVGPVTSGQSYAVSPIQTTTYTLTVTNAAGDKVTQDLEVALVPRGIFTAGPALGTPRRDHTATLLADGRVLIAGGISGDGTGQILTVAEIYDPVSNTFAPASAMTDARQYHTAVRLVDGRVLLAGGTSDGTSALQSAEIFDPATGTFTSLGTAVLNTGRFLHGAALLPDGRVLITGGCDGTVSLASAEIFDPATGLFTATAPMGTARQDHAILTLADGTVLVAGGATLSASGTLILASAELFTPSTALFSATTSTLTTGRQHPATALPSTGKPLFFGGLGFNGQWLETCEAYTPATRSFASTGSISGPFQSPAASLLPDGRVLILGVGGAQIYDPATGQCADVNGTGSLTTGGITATLLPTGKVLIIGLDGALLFDPQIPQP